MPIVTRTLRYVRPQRDGSVRVQEDLVDGKGRKWFHSYKIASEVDATARMNARDLTEQLQDADRQDLLAWVQGRNQVADFDFTDRDITEDDGEEYIMTWFAEFPGSEAVSVAWWLEGINTGQFNAIRDRVGYTGIEGSTITSKFTFLLTAEPWLDTIVEAP